MINVIMSMLVWGAIGVVVMCTTMFITGGICGLETEVEVLNLINEIVCRFLTKIGMLPESIITVVIGTIINIMLWPIKLIVIVYSVCKVVRKKN